LEFKVYSAKDFTQPMDSGVSLYLYRVFVNGSHRAPKGRVESDGTRHRTKLPLDLHFLLTAWGRDASLQHAIAGWMMRMMEDTPVLPAGLLNTRVQDVFDPGETMELSLGELDTENLLRLWEILTQNLYHISIPYIARNIYIESTRTLAQGASVQERTFDYRNVMLEENP
jgi:hypothetical protein